MNHIKRKTKHGLHSSHCKVNDSTFWNRKTKLSIIVIFFGFVEKC